MFVLTLLPLDGILAVSRDPKSCSHMNQTTWVTLVRGQHLTILINMTLSWTEVVRLLWLFMMTQIANRPSQYSPGHSVSNYIDDVWQSVDLLQVDSGFASILIFVCHIHLCGHVGSLCFVWNIIPNAQISDSKGHCWLFGSFGWDCVKMKSKVSCCLVTSVCPPHCGEGTGRADTDDHTRRACQLDPVTHLLDITWGILGYFQQPQTQWILLHCYLFINLILCLFPIVNLKTHPGKLGICRFLGGKYGQYF